MKELFIDKIGENIDCANYIDGKLCYATDSGKVVIGDQSFQTSFTFISEIFRLKNKIIVKGTIERKGYDYISAILVLEEEIYYFYNSQFLDCSILEGNKIFITPSSMNIFHIYDGDFNLLKTVNIEDRILQVMIMEKDRILIHLENWAYCRYYIKSGKMEYFKLDGVRMRVSICTLEDKILISERSNPGKFYIYDSGMNLLWTCSNKGCICRPITLCGMRFVTVSGNNTRIYKYKDEQFTFIEHSEHLYAPVKLSEDEFLVFSDTEANICDCYGNLLSSLKGHFSNRFIKKGNMILFWKENTIYTYIYKSKFTVSSFKDVTFNYE